MRFRKEFLISFFMLATVLLSAIRTASASTVLQSGSTSFTIASIALHTLQLSGDLNHLRVYWDASYLTGVEQNIDVNCYLNCNPIDDPIQCDGYPDNCTYLGPPGAGVCTMQPANYVYPLNTPENATCIFSNPASPDIEYKKADGTYPNKTFYPINFNIYISPDLKVAVGKENSMSVVVQNIGVITDNYTQNVTAFPANFVTLDSKTRSTYFGPLVGDSFGNTPQSFVSLAKFVILSTTSPINIIVNITSAANTTIYKEQVVQLRAGISSLPDFGWIGILQIAVIAAIVLFLVRKKL